MSSNLEARWRSLTPVVRLYHRLVSALPGWHRWRVEWLAVGHRQQLGGGERAVSGRPPWPPPRLPPASASRPHYSTRTPQGRRKFWPPPSPWCRLGEATLPFVGGRRHLLPGRPWAAWRHHPSSPCPRPPVSVARPRQLQQTAPDDWKFSNPSCGPSPVSAFCLLFSSFFAFLASFRAILRFLLLLMVRQPILANFWKVEVRTFEMWCDLHYDRKAIIARAKPSLL